MSATSDSRGDARHWSTAVDDVHAATVRRRDETLRRWGMRSWMFVGIAAGAAVLAGAFGAISGLVVPLVVAVVVGVLFVPAVDRLARVMPRPFAAAIVLLGLLVVAALSVVLAVAGVVDQAPSIARNLGAGLDRIVVWLDDLDLQVVEAEQMVADLGDLWGIAVPGLASYLGTVFSSTAAFFAGSFVAVFMLYFILADWEELRAWVGSHLGVDEPVGAEVVDDTTWSLRQYFAALTISSVIVAILVGATVAVLGVPLALTIALVTFFTSYVPYLGALFSGAFAVLIALGSGGVGDAVIVLVVVLVAQNVVQTIVQTKMTEGRLALHPIVIFGSTIVGGATLGLLGAALSTPAVAVLVKVSRRLAAVRDRAEVDDGQ